jgi:hypothetical protein
LIVGFNGETDLAHPDTELTNANVKPASLGDVPELQQHEPTIATVQHPEVAPSLLGYDPQIVSICGSYPKQL